MPVDAGRHAEPVLEAFRTWLDIEELLVLPKSPIGDAIRYARNQWIPLTRFLEDGRLSLDFASEMPQASFSTGRCAELRESLALYWDLLQSSV